MAKGTRPAPRRYPTRATNEIARLLRWAGKIAETIAKPAGKKQAADVV